MDVGRPRILTDQQRKANKAAEQRKRRASPLGRLWSAAYYRRPEVKARKKVLSKLPKQRDHIRNWELKKDFGITLEDFRRMEAEQNGLCAICSKAETNGKRLSVDHCHTTKKVRGLLCGNCNRGLGLFKDNQAYLKEAIKYLHG